MSKTKPATNGKEVDPRAVERTIKQMELEADMKRREQECAKKIEEALKEFGCALFCFNTVDQQSGVAIPKASIRALPPKE